VTLYTDFRRHMVLGVTMAVLLTGWTGTERWWAFRCRPDDEAGALNEITPEHAVEGDGPSARWPRVRHPNGLGNSSGVVGRYLMLHNNSSLIAISTIPNPTIFEKTLGVNDFYYGDGEWGYPLGAMQMLGKSDAFTISLDAPHADDPADLAAHSLDFWLTTEDLPL
jgi:hypothetical protein